ncbi:hypothetical protein LINPERPRIM_LOCUS4317 [Linum perenne]
MLDIPHKTNALSISSMLLKCKAAERSSQHCSHSPTTLHVHQICGSFLSCGSTCCQESSQLMSC